jgi:two-component system, NarL family, invasion response regulator UvrY
MIRILIADDHPIVRQGLRRILSEETDMHVVGEAETSQEALDLFEDGEWDVVVLDLAMPGRGGIEVLKEIRRQRPRVPVLILSVSPEEQLAIRALKAGAAGYVTKLTAPGELVTAIRKAVSGGRYVSAQLAERLALQASSATRRVPHDALSDREYQVLRLLAAGKTITEIARELTLSVKTISTHRSRILEKLNLRTTAELIRYALEHSLAE